MNVDKVLKRLNDLLKLDRDAVNNLLNVRIECFKNISQHVEIVSYDELHWMGVLGIINSLLDSGVGIVAVRSVKCPTDISHENERLESEFKIGSNGVMLRNCSKCNKSLIVGPVIEFRKADTKIFC